MIQALVSLILFVDLALADILFLSLGSNKS